MKRTAGAADSFFQLMARFAALYFVEKRIRVACSG